MALALTRWGLVFLGVVGTAVTLRLAAEPFVATFVASVDCPATPAIRRPDNPGAVRLVPGRSYGVIERNRPEPSHYLVRIDGAVPPSRWVAAECGRIEGGHAEARSAMSASTGASMADQYVLAASWQPAFCERRQDKPECRAQSEDRPDARRFSLHGLWPQPIGRAYCGVTAVEREQAESGRWERLPEPVLGESTRAALAERMPGVRSGLERHEWTKHGTCYGKDADAYFRDAMALLDRLNASAVQALMETHIGQRLRAEEVRDAFDQAFGKGAGERVRLECDPDGNIVELRIGLKGQIGAGADLGELIGAAPPRGPGCRGGWVDRAGVGR